MTLCEKVNVIVDKLVGLGIIAGIAEDDVIKCIYPFEQILVSMEGGNVTGPLKSVFGNRWGHGPHNGMHVLPRQENYQQTRI